LAKAIESKAFSTYYKKSERLNGDGENFIREVLSGVADTDITVAGTSRHSQHFRGSLRLLLRRFS
jgi:hypothetical protein